MTMMDNYIPPKFQQITSNTFAIDSSMFFRGKEPLAPNRVFEKVDFTNSILIRSDSFSTLVNLRKKPVTSTPQEGIRANLALMQTGIYYPVEFEGKKYAIRLSEDGYLERYSVEE